MLRFTIALALSFASALSAAAATTVYVRVQDKAVLEPAEGIAELTASIFLTQAAETDLTFTIDFYDAPKSGNESAATQGVDYVILPQTVQIKKGENAAEAHFAVFSDTLEESAETWRITARPQSGTPYYTTPGWITILDDDARLRFTADHISVFSGDEFILELELPYPSGTGAAVTLTIYPLYIAAPPKGTVAFPPASWKTTARLKANVPDDGVITAEVRSPQLAPATINVRVYGGAVTIQPERLVLAPGQGATVTMTMSPAPPEWVELPVAQQRSGFLNAPSKVEIAPNGKGTYRIDALAPGTTAIDVISPGGRVLATLPVEVTRPTQLTAVSPAAGTTSGGTPVTITGAEFTSACTVKFGSTAATSVTFVGTNTLAATTPAHAAGKVDVVVTCGTSTVTLANGFAFVDARKRAVRH